MTKPIYVEHDALDTAAISYDVHHKALVEILDNLEAGLAPMIASWGGTAQAAYLRKKAGWDQGAADLAVLLANIKAVTDGAYDGYVQTVQDVGDLWT